VVKIAVLGKATRNENMLFTMTLGTDSVLRLFTLVINRPDVSGHS
jgi:hypothetical protein